MGARYSPAQSPTGRREEWRGSLVLEQGTGRGMSKSSLPPFILCTSNLTPANVLENIPFQCVDFTFLMLRKSMFTYRKLLLAYAISTLLGCTSQKQFEYSRHFYSGNEKSIDDLAMLSTFGATPGILVREIDSKSLMTSSSPIGDYRLIAPGQHEITAEVRFATPNGGAKVFKGSVTYNFAAKHTYLLEYQVKHDEKGKEIAAVKVVDYGVDFPRQCLPIHILNSRGAYTYESLKECLNEKRALPIERGSDAMK